MYSRKERLVDELCEEIDILKFALKQERQEHEQLKKEHRELVASSLQHSQHMSGNILKLLLDTPKKKS